MFIDTHTHFYSEQFDKDREESIKRAKALGVTRFILPAIDSESIEPMEQLHKQHPDIMYKMAGLHPAYVKTESYKQELEIVAQQLRSEERRVGKECRSTGW